MYASLADRSSSQLLNRLARLDVLLIDELGYLNLKPEQSIIFFKLMEERYHRHSTIITSNLGYDEWRNFLGNQAMVNALLSRLRHYCHTVHLLAVNRFQSSSKRTCKINLGMHVGDHNSCQSHQVRASTRHLKIT
jgi:DNA replication protein DnaC